MNDRQARWIEAYKTAADQNRSMGAGYYKVTKFEQEELGRDYIMVNRSYTPAHLTRGPEYVDCFTLGPRCGTKKIYSRIYV